MAAREREIFGAGAWSESLIRQDYLMGPSRYRGAELDGELVGYAVYGYDGDAFSLLNLAVLPHARRRGVGRAFVEDMLAEARSERAREVWLEVAHDNADAIALYESFGFALVRVRRKYYQPGDVDAWVMRRVTDGSEAHATP